jgi:acyl carrier protein
MAYDDYITVIQPKVLGAWNFHHVLAGTPLDFFVTISSAAGTIGNRGQAAYAAANTFLDAFVQHRIAKGLPATTINLTAVSDVGYIADNAERADEVAKNFGGETINEVEVLALIGAAIMGRMAKACNSHSITGMKITNSAPPFWSSDPKFTHLVEAAAAAAASSSTETVKVSLSTALRASRSPEESEGIIREGLADKVANLVMLEKEEIDISKSIADYGLDSLVVIELRNFITREFEANMQVLELLNSGSITKLAKTVCGKSKLLTAGTNGA